MEEDPWYKDMLAKATIEEKIKWYRAGLRIEKGDMSAVNAFPQEFRDHIDSLTAEKNKIAENKFHEHMREFAYRLSNLTP
jgi:hypothetical protein